MASYPALHDTYPALQDNFVFLAGVPSSEGNVFFITAQGELLERQFDQGRSNVGGMWSNHGKPDDSELVTAAPRRRRLESRRAQLRRACAPAHSWPRWPLSLVTYTFRRLVPWRTAWTTR